MEKASVTGIELKTRRVFFKIWRLRAAEGGRRKKKRKKTELALGSVNFQCCFCRAGPMRFEDGFWRKGISVTQRKASIVCLTDQGIKENPGDCFGWDGGSVGFKFHRFWTVQASTMSPINYQAPRHRTEHFQGMPPERHLGIHLNTPPRTQNFPFHP